MSEKLIRDGMVAILYSPWFGAGWSTWGSPWLATDRRLVEAFERGDDLLPIAEAISLEKGGDGYVYGGGLDGLQITWLPEGTAFRIHEYDGSESVDTASVLDQVA